MATPTAKTVTETITELPAIAQKSREQFVSNLEQGQKLSIDAAQTWVKAVSALPVMDLPKIPGFSALPSIEATTTFTFDLAAELLNLQREFALELTNTFVPTKAA